MKILGIDTSALPDQFDNAVPGRVLILDGDGPCYRASATAKRLDTALRHFQQEVLKDMFMVGAQTCRIHLTARDSDKHGRFRVKAVKPYQGNRQGKSKPPLLEPLREMVADNSTWLEEYSVFMHRELEADDGMIQDAYLFKENGIIDSDDKDLRMTPYPYYDRATGRVLPPTEVGWVSSKHTDGGTFKLIGHGPLFFWAQLMMGDTADNIQGLLRYKGKLCGPVAAYEALYQVQDIDVAANLVIDAYRAIDQNVLAEAWLLWLTRWRKDNVVNYITSLNLSEENAAFIQDCLQRDWVTPKEVKDGNDEAIYS